jgi:hypothetical protein
MVMIAKTGHQNIIIFLFHYILLSDELCFENTT